MYEVFFELQKNSFSKNSLFFVNLAWLLLIRVTDNKILHEKMKKKD